VLSSVTHLYILPTANFNLFAIVFSNMSTDTSVKTATFEELRKAWPAAGHKELVKAAGAEVRYG
jgi:hypothetical protein